MRLANMGSLDRIIRLIIGVVALIAPFYLSLAPSSIPAIVLFVVAGIMIVTALTRFCPLYTIFGLRTAPRD